MLRALLVEFIKVIFQIIGAILWWVFVDANEEYAWKRLLLLLLAMIELFVIVAIAWYLQPQLPIWGFVLAVFCLVFAGAFGFFAVAQLMVKKIGRA